MAIPIADVASCGFAVVDGGPDGLAFMVNRDSPDDGWRIVRLDVSDDRIATGGGTRVGSTEDEVRRVYGDKTKTEPHYDTSEKGGTIWSSTWTGRGYETPLRDGRHEGPHLSSGFQSAVEAVEGCL